MRRFQVRRRGRRWRLSVPEPKAYFTELLPAQFERALRAQERAVEAAQRVLDGMRAVRTRRSPSTCAARAAARSS